MPLGTKSYKAQNLTNQLSRKMKKKSKRLKSKIFSIIFLSKQKRIAVQSDANIAQSGTNIAQSGTNIIFEK